MYFELNSEDITIAVD